MKQLTSVSYIGSLNGKQLRFFKAQLPGPHLPWHSIDDLQQCLEMDPDLRSLFFQRLKGAWKDETKTVATAAGVTNIGPHWMAQGLIGGMIENAGVSSELETAYAKEVVSAWKATVGDLPAGTNLDQVIAALRNTNGLVGENE